MGLGNKKKGWKVFKTTKLTRVVSAMHTFIFVFPFLKP